MRINIEYSGSLLNISLDIAGEPKHYSFNFDNDIDLTNLVLDISESESIIEIDPSNFDIFKSTFECESKVMKLTEYIYKIIEVFNDAYKEVYPDQCK